MLSLERLADEEVAELVEAALAGPLDSQRAGAGHRPCGGQPVLRRGGARGPPRQRAARADGTAAGRFANGAVDLGDPGLGSGRPRRPHRPAAGRGEGGAPGGGGDRPLVHSGRPGRARPARAPRCARSSSAASSARPSRSSSSSTRSPARSPTAACRRRAGRACTPPSRAGCEGEDATDGRAGALAHHYSEAVAPGIAELAWRDREDELRRALGGGAALAAPRRRALAGALRPRRRPLAASPRRRARAGRGRAVARDRPGERSEVRRRGDVAGDAEGDRADGGHGGAGRAVCGAHVRVDACAAGCGSVRSTTPWSRAGSPERSSSPMPAARRRPEPSSPSRCGRTTPSSAEQAVALAERLDDPVLLSYAYWARSGAAFIGLDFHEAERLATTPLRAPRSPDRSRQDRPHPVLRSDGRARRRPAGRGRGARAQARPSPRG